MPRTACSMQGEQQLGVLIAAAQTALRAWLAQQPPSELQARKNDDLVVPECSTDLRSLNEFDLRKE
jgi:hypothetical protein